MSWEISCADMCRACMKVDGVLLPMYDDDTISQKNLPDKLAELASIQIDKFDGLPNMLCAKCAYRTDAFYDFKLQVQATEKKLRKMFETQIRYAIKEEAISNDFEPDSSEQSNELLQAKLLDDKQDIKPLSNADSSEEFLPGEMNMNDKGEQFDMSELVEESEEFNKAEISELRGIIISKLSEAEVDPEKRLKGEIPDEISKIFESQQLDYTIMYIPEEDVSLEDVGHVNTDNSVSCDPIKLDDNKEMIETSCNGELLDEPMGSEEFLNAVCNEKNVEMETSRIHNDKIAILEEKSRERMNGKHIRKVSLEVHPHADDSEDSDSDYFVDPKDNILGSLNDTITRIKEIKLEDDVVQYQCTLCLQNYDKLTGVLLHTIDNHVPSSGPFFCVVCEKDCESHRELRTHVKTHTGQFPYSCFICSKAYAMKRYLKRHMVCHTDFPRYRCPKCGLRFKIKSELESHITTHIRGAPYACSQCPRLFNHKGNYKRHLITHLDPQGLHLPKYPCKVCGKRFLNNRTLETHMRVHTGEKPFKCDVCGRSFSQQGNLLNHVRIHSNPRSYTCEVCGKRFNQRATLRDHSLLHTGEKPYVCNVCGIAFTFSAALRRHMWTHTGGKPFGCEICSARFVGKYDLRRHMRIHTDRPKTKRRKNVIKSSSEQETKEENGVISDHPDTDTVLIEQVLLTQDVTQVVQQQESEKENVDALFNLIQYG
ncbi:Zinc finger protein 235 [Habropoda laboriosa]|uniref:Zinc finger protein 235 n=1 Tax=Habropoda laboriosa TaxID=597456 RepID=A0A0L7QP92_9HYME|nr:PREDICTED: zinc finger protein 2 homolog [Habropoda laboriosa]KOC60316.1 Zinc finger protein 235 [Habropoda laboriosa]